MSHKGWIGVDLDGTLALYTGWQGAEHIGDPIPKMLDRVLDWLKAGVDVRIFTARVYSNKSSERDAEAYLARKAIEAWCLKHLGQVIPITNEKDYGMIQLWDDRCVQVTLNTGQTIIEAMSP